MTVATVELASRLLPFVLILVAVPLSYLLLFRLADDAELEELTDRQADGRQERAQFHTAETGTDDEHVRCRECGTENESSYTFCRSCVARIGA